MSLFISYSYGNAQFIYLSLNGETSHIAHMNLFFQSLFRDYFTTFLLVGVHLYVFVPTEARSIYVIPFFSYTFCASLRA